MNIKVVQPQSKKASLAPDAPIKEMIAWKPRRRRWTIGGLKSKDCKLSYDITIQTLDPANNYFERQLWQLDLAGLNPQMIRVKPTTKDEPVDLPATLLVRVVSKTS